jgi:hypothetical protein
MPLQLGSNIHQSDNHRKTSVFSGFMLHFYFRLLIFYVGCLEGFSASLLQENITPFQVFFDNFIIEMPDREQFKVFVVFNIKINAERFYQKFQFNSGVIHTNCKTDG